MAREMGKKEQSGPGSGLKRRGLLRFGSLITAFTGASAISALTANGANAGPGDKNPPTNYVPIAEKGAASGVATLNLESKIPSAQLPDLSATYVQASTKGVAAGVASLDSAAKVPIAQIPDQFSTYLTKAPSSNDTTIGAMPVQIVTGNKWFRGPVVFGNPDGLAANPRAPFQVSNVIDGSLLTGATYGSDKVANANVVIFKGGFSNEARYGVSNPNFIFGANDFIITGKTAGDVVGIGDMWGRLSEVHLYTPNASIVNLYGLIGESEVLATGATVTGWMASLVAHAPKGTTHGTIANAASLRVNSPLPGLATNQYAIYQEGTGLNQFNGKIEAKGGFFGTSPNSQAAALGVYVGSNAGSPAIEFADGTNNFRIDNTSGKFRVLRAGVTSLLEIDVAGRTKITGGVGVNGSTPVTKQTVTGSRGGNAALASVLTALAAYGFITDSTTA